MTNNPQRTTTLFQRYIDGSITRAEYLEFLALLDDETDNPGLSDELKALWAQSADHPIVLPGSEWDGKMAYLLQQINNDQNLAAPVRQIKPWLRFAWAAAILLIVLSGAFYLLVRQEKPSYSNQVAVVRTDTVKGILPGGNKAVLMLADGTSIVLDSSLNGTLASQGTAQVIKLNSGQLMYNSGGAKAGAVLYNTLSTPIGGQYQVTLTDGTVVWLNSGSSLRFPTAFTEKQRKVEIRGEAYFEVAKNAAKPFQVAIKLASGEGGEVEVLGTHFNINAYDDEETVRTTLLEGSIHVSRDGKRAQIKPGQQAQSAAGQMEVVNDVDPEEVVAWKEGRFQFENAPIKDVMRQLARWYGLEVNYKETVTGHFDGTISRNVNVSKVLDMLELTGEVRFKIEGRKVTVSP